MKKAKKIDLFDVDGNLWKMKGVVNEENQKEYFNTVSDGYNIVQHDEVISLVEEAIKDKNLNPKKSIEELNEGARLHIELTFPEISLDVEGNGQQVSLRCSYDNSYDGTTGLRLEVGAESPYGGGFLWVGGLVKAIEDNYYHRHTKGVNVAEFEKKLDKGIESFQTKIKEHFTKMFKTSATNEEAQDFLDGSIDIKGISKIYIESIKSAVSRSTIKNKWQLYCVICDTVTKEAASLDVRNRQLALLITRLHNSFKKNEKASSPSTEGGESLSPLSDVVKEYASKNNIDVTELPLSQVEPDEFLGMMIETKTIPTKLTIDKKAKNKFVIMQGNTVLQEFRKYKQAAKFLQRAS
jgi:hypothetical protein